MAKGKQIAARRPQQGAGKSQSYGQLQVVARNHPKIQELDKPEVHELLNQYLVGTALNGRLLVSDLMAACTVNPKLLTCTPQSLFNVLIAAARYGCTIGETGVWPVVRNIEEDGQGSGSGRVPTAMPQLSYKRKVQVAKQRGAFDVVSEVVVQGEKFKPITDGGILVGVDHEIDYTKPRIVTRETVVCAWGAIVFNDGRRHYRIVTKEELIAAEAASAAKTSDKVPWKTHYGPMCKKTVDHRLTSEFIVDFTNAATQGDAQMITEAPVSSDVAIDADFENITGEDLAGELNNRGQGYDDEPDSPTYEMLVARAVEILGTAESSADFKLLTSTHAEFLEIWGISTDEMKGSIKGLGDEILAGLIRKEQARAANPHGAPPGSGAAQAEPAPTPLRAGGAEGGAMESTQATEPGGAPPPPEVPFPAITLEMLTYEDQENNSTGLARALKELREAWSSLSKNPEAIENAVFNGEKEWMGMMDEAQVEQYERLKELLHQELGAAGFPNQI